MFPRNLPMLVQRRGGESAPQHQAVLYGTVGTERLIVGGLTDAVYEEGEELVVRMMLRNNAVGFRSRVEAVTDVDQNLYFLSYPQFMDSLDLRKSQRLGVLIPAEVQFSGTDDTEESLVHLLEGVVLDISGDGCRLGSKRPIPANASVSLTFSLPGDRFVYRVEGKVLRKANRKQAFVQGVQFPRTPRNLPAMLDLGRWVQQHLVFAGT